MKLNIAEKIEQKLLSRTKIVGELNFDAATPSNDDLKKAISTELKCAQNLIVITNIYTKFGAKSATFSAYAYDNEKDMKDVERIKEETKAEGEEKKEDAPKAAEKPAQAPKEGAKTDDPKEEKKEESKKEEKAPEKKE